MGPTVGPLNLFSRVVVWDLRYVIGLKQGAVIDEAIVLSPIDFKAADREADHRSHERNPRLKIPPLIPGWPQIVTVTGDANNDFQIRPVTTFVAKFRPFWTALACVESAWTL